MGRNSIRPIRIVGNDAFITLTRGLVTVIDAEDVPLVSNNNWSALVNPNVRYAAAQLLDCRTGRRKTVLLHQLIWPVSPGVIDHIDGDGLNNRVSNLRSASKSENAQNSRLAKTNTSGLKGVSWHSGGQKWVASIRANGRNCHLGLFSSKEQARAVYLEASARLHGQFSRP